MLKLFHLRKGKISGLGGYEIAEMAPKVAVTQSDSSLILRLDNLVKCCDLILLMLAYSFVLLELENRRGKRLLYVWSVKRMKRKRKRNSGGEEGRKGRRFEWDW